LRRRFALVSLGVITVIALGLGWLMSHMLTQRMLQREGEVSMDFIQNLLLTDQRRPPILSNPDDATLREVPGSPWRMWPP
jgi:two-component system sensor histidine kinase HydH